MKSLAYQALAIAKEIQKEQAIQPMPPSGGTVPKNQPIIPHAMVKSTRGYIEKIAYQINGCYEAGCFDACAVMMRRLLETLIIECFEEYKIESKIKNTTGDYMFLSDLIGVLMSEASWALGRNSKKALPKLKDIGDKSAHSRRFNAHREDVDNLIVDFRTTCQELLYLAKLS